MKEILQSKVMIAFIIFVLAVTCLYEPQKNDSSQIASAMSQNENLNK